MSGFIPERVLDEIRFRNDIVEVIGAYVPLKRTGSTYKACCPFHKEKTPSFNVNPNMQIFKCFGCGEGGDVIGFMMKHQGMDFVTAARALAERAGIEIEVEADNGEGARRKALYAIHHGIAQFYRRCLEQFPAAGKARAYVEARKLGGEIAEAFQIGYAPAGWDIAIKWGAKYGYSPDQLEQAGLVLRSTREGKHESVYDRFRDRLMFPIHDSQGRVIAFSARILVKDPKQPKYVNSPETPIFSKGRVLYGLDKARRNIVNSPSREALICEGQIDVVRCHQFGFDTAVAAQGTAFTDEHVQLLKHYADSVVLVFDADAAGQAAAVKTAHLFMKAGLVVRVAVLPVGSDPDSFLCEQGADAFRACLEKADSVVAYQIRVLSAREPDARGIAATARIANAVLETLCHSPNAVQRERMLQEAAALLGLPQRALEADLAVMEAKQRDQAERYGRRDSSRGEPPARRAPREGAPVEAMPPLDDRDFQSEAAFDEPPPDVLERLPVTGAPASASASSVASAPGPRAPSLSPVPPEERDLCEHLIQGAGDLQLVRLVEENLPLQLLESPTVRLLVEGVLAAAREGASPVDYLTGHLDGEAAAAALALCKASQGQPVRVRGGGDYTRTDAVKDLILGFWRRNLQAQRKRLALPGAGGTDPASAARRIQITLDLKALQHWEAGQDVIQIECAMLTEQADAAKGAAPDRS